jgi:hypothetical protein
VVDADDDNAVPARGDRDDLVHAVDVPSRESALLDPSPHTARCGQAVLELYNDKRQVTCPACA